MLEIDVSSISRLPKKMRQAIVVHAPTIATIGIASCRTDRLYALANGDEIQVTAFIPLKSGAIAAKPIKFRKLASKVL